MYTLHTRFCTFGTHLCAQSALINKISASELRRKLIKSALLVGVRTSPTISGRQVPKEPECGSLSYYVEYSGTWMFHVSSVLGGVCVWIMTCYRQQTSWALGSWKVERRTNFPNWFLTPDLAEFDCIWRDRGGGGGGKRRVSYPCSTIHPLEEKIREAKPSKIVSPSLTSHHFASKRRRRP